MYKDEIRFRNLSNARKPAKKTEHKNKGLSTNISFRVKGAPMPLCKERLQPDVISLRPQYIQILLKPESL
jgi:hypothetical protein